MDDNKKYTGFTSTQIGDPDPETGKVTFDVEYNADFNLIRKKFNELQSKYYDDFLKHKDVRDDKKFIEIGKGIDYLVNQYVNHIAKYYKKVRLDKLSENKVRDIIRKALDEESSTGAGASAGSFNPGTGANYATPNAFNPNKKAKGAQNIYYYKLGWKPVDAKKLHKQAKGLEHKDLWTKKLEETEKSPALENFINTRITDFDKIEEKINALRPLLEKAKAETMEYYKTSPNFQIKYGTDLASDYLDDLITLFKDKQ
jgi:hypothetical protein